MAATPGSEGATSRPPALPALTGLRFLAALWVLLHHFAPYNWYGAHKTTLDVVLGAGPAGVTVFFVLSGFILAYSYVGEDGRLRGTARAFWVARAARVYPVYLLAWALAAPGALRAWPVLGGARHGPLAGLAALGLLQSWLPQAWANAWNGPGWTLSVEALFYAAFPALVSAGALAWPGRGRRLWPSLLGCWALGLALPLACALPRGPGATDALWAQVAWRNPLVHLPTFALGSLLALLLRRRGRGGRASRPWLWSALGAAGALAVALDGRVPDAVWQHGLVVPLAAALVWALAGRRGLPARLLSAPALVALGEASYGLYILQAPLWTLLTWAKPGLATAGLSHAGLGAAGARTWLFVGVYAAVAVAASLLSLRLLEDPARRAIRRRMSGTPGTGAAATSASLGVRGARPGCRRRPRPAAGETPRALPGCVPPRAAPQHQR